MDRDNTPRSFDVKQSPFLVGLMNKIGRIDRIFNIQRDKYEKAEALFFIIVIKKVLIGTRQQSKTKKKPK
jgi:hypothetical protein